MALRDENPFTRCNRLAEEAAAKKRAEASGWWKSAHKWVGLEIEHDPTMMQALRNIARQCPDYPDAVRVLEMGRSEYRSEWRGVDWNHLDELAADARMNGQYTRRRIDEVNALIEEARRVLREARLTREVDSV